MRLRASAMSTCRLVPFPNHYSVRSKLHETAKYSDIARRTGAPVYAATVGRGGKLLCFLLANVRINCRRRWKVTTTKQALRFVLFLVPVLTTILLVGCQQHQYRIVSLATLVATPERLLGQGVSVMGFLKRDAGLKLFLTSEHARFGDIASSVTILDATEGALLFQSPCSGAWVRVYGVFARMDGALPAIRDVSAVRRSDGELCWEPTKSQELEEFGEGEAS